MSPHSNPHYEILMVSDGPVYLQVNEEKLTLKTGDCLLISPWEQHHGWRRNDGRGSFFWVQFTIDPAPAFIEEQNHTSALLPLNQLNSIHLRTTDDTRSEQLLIPRLFAPAQRYECLRTFEQMVHEFFHPKGYFKFRLTRFLCKLIELMAEDVLNGLLKDSSLPASYATYRNLIDCLHESYTMECSADFIEKTLDRRYEYLCQIFRKYSGMTISAYIQHLRIQKAKHLLQSSSKTIQEITADVGMKDSFYFSRMFKKIEGETPSRFRVMNNALKKPAK
ncbi:helix-turn-helix domain-containing protein [Paenibacillus oceani]|uniref:AraC family transcriptional regulator n=1 Tax=Paenibacillus oceani TaxID=2772510 RepID=A0A927C3P5_9BACL|nr:helix-turn-helix domain-containing protein [Paenibacillus oceani]MBD2860744.1 AraC family transcriptional regulator [Paenibacillus oceani]